MIETWPIEKLKGWDKNPRSIKDEDFQRLKNQIQKLGIYKPLLINKEGTVLGGNMRLKAYTDLGLKEVEVSIVDAPTEARMLEFALSDNDRIGFYEEEDLTKLVERLQKEINLEDYKVDLAEASSLEKLIESLANKELEGISLKDGYEVVIECTTEEEQKELYERFEKEGLKCRLLTL